MITGIWIRVRFFIKYIYIMLPWLISYHAFINITRKYYVANLIAIKVLFTYFSDMYLICNFLLPWGIHVN